LAQRLEVSERTVYRDIADLQHQRCIGHCCRAWSTRSISSTSSWMR
jgi:predicted DNA-binding transcriptional regulator YafY